MAAVSDLRLDVAAQLPGCPYPMVDRAIVRAARELCDAVPLWRVDLDDIDLAANTAEYTLSLPSAVDAGEIVRPIARGVRYRGTPLENYDETVLYGQRREWQSDTGDHPRGFVMLTPRKLALVPIPDSNLDDPLKVTVSVRPTYGATTIDDSVALDWREALTGGALGILLAMPNEPWANGELALVHRRSFGAAKADAIAQYARGYQRGTARARPQPFTRSLKRFR